jgi:hypothetical protein
MVEVGRGPLDGEAGPAPHLGGGDVDLPARIADVAAGCASEPPAASLQVLARPHGGRPGGAEAAAQHVVARGAERPDPLDQERSARRRGEVSLPRHLVGDRRVGLVPDPRQHRYVEGGDGPGEGLAVEGRQVGAGPAAPDEAEHVDAGCRDRPHRGDQ